MFPEIIARFFNKLPDFIGLPNIILNRMAIPELIQRDLTPEKLAEYALRLYESTEARQKQKQDLAEVISHLGLV